ncbi:DUF6488 family protein [Zooshikella sp. RANM57]|uniref:DUF6488 family protein n=1 Tax=Zooshikella sp. RANM57 TaxID=3425863 RepID=UPI003D6FD77D
MSVLRLLCIAMLSAVLTSPAHAHSNHGFGTPITETQASERADMVKAQLVSTKQVADSWQKIKDGSVSQKEVEGGKFWVVKYDDPNAANPTNKTLYVFLDELGNVITANYTGEF